MENKYYTPSIEEFHKGFLYQEGDGFNPVKKWSNEIAGVTDDLDINIYDDLINESQIRVKHLDLEDIKELDWEETDETVETIYFSLKGFELAFNKNNFKIEIYNTNVEYSDGELIYKGIANNKSELKKLMQQLEIFPKI
tara:strand:+ start:125 stop:541 length:417 start_codon:yes stop_codon:yes gene_type:complete